MYRQDEPEVNLEQILERIRSFLRRFNLGGGGDRGVAYILLAGLLVAAIAWGSTGFYTVQPGEQAALRYLGKFSGTEGPGLHWYWPAPIGTRALVDVENVFKLEVGFRGTTPFPEESLMITGDEALVDLQMVVQYDIQRSITDQNGQVISAVEQYLFRSKDPDGIILRSATESALRQVVGQRVIDDVLGLEKEQAQAEVKVLLQRLLDTYQTGLRVREVRLQSVLPPAQVQEAFFDVTKAEEDKDRIEKEAQAYEADILPKAEGEALRTIETARGFRAAKIADAIGQAERFSSVLAAYQTSPEVTRQRLYLDAMEDVLPGISKLILDPQINSIVISTDSSSERVLPVPSPETQR